MGVRRQYRSDDTTPAGGDLLKLRGIGNNLARRENWGFVYRYGFKSLHFPFLSLKGGRKGL